MGDKKLLNVEERLRDAYSRYIRAGFAREVGSIEVFKNPLPPFSQMSKELREYAAGLGNSEEERGAWTAFQSVAIVGIVAVCLFIGSFFLDEGKPLRAIAVVLGFLAVVVNSNVEEKLEEVEEYMQEKNCIVSLCDEYEKNTQVS